MTDTEKSLKEISELLFDSKLGYMEAARRADDLRLKQLLLRIADSRSAMIEVVGSELDGLGAARPHQGTFKGALHRGWMAMRDLISNTNDVNMLAECRRGESYLVGCYDSHLRKGVDGLPFHGMLEEQRAVLMGNLDEIRSLDAVLSEI